jgi:hypothetical protein
MEKLAMQLFGNMSLHTCVADKNVSADWALQQQSAVRESTC